MPSTTATATATVRNIACSDGLHDAPNVAASVDTAAAAAPTIIYAENRHDAGSFEDHNENIDNDDDDDDDDDDEDDMQFDNTQGLTLNHADLNTLLLGQHQHQHQSYQQDTANAFRFSDLFSELSSTLPSSSPNYAHMNPINNNNNNNNSQNSKMQFATSAYNGQVMPSAMSRQQLVPTPSKFPNPFTHYKSNDMTNNKPTATMTPPTTTTTTTTSSTNTASKPPINSVTSAAKFYNSFYRTPPISHQLDI